IPGNCGEYPAADGAFAKGIPAERLVTVSIYAETGETLPRCLNCKRVFLGTHAPADQGRR
ncbi:MAG: hypothetical protein L0206_18155, partial [Actinobacteria bacterium]|nr:hypothetical protein [Actinomycetota bacterium]